MEFKRIWIEEGCIACNLCEDLVPEVFHVPAGEDCRVRSGWAEHLASSPDQVPAVREAAESCPVEVIQLEE